MTEKPFQFAKTFLRERCDYCGRCFSECPVMELPPVEARHEIRALAESGMSLVLDRCTGCMACNSICPTGANPHTLIVNAWERRYKKRGLPGRAALVLPYSKPNLYTILREHLPEDEKSMVGQWEENWRNPPACDTMVYAGCNLILQPFLAKSRLFEGVPILGSPGLCCGEPLYRSGCWEAARAAAEHVRREFTRMRLRRVIVPCLAGYHLFRHVYPEVFDVRLECEIISVEDWLLDRVAHGGVSITPLNKRAVIHDNCWPKASGSIIFDSVRSLLGKFGVEVIEPPHTRAAALCCGMCAGAARFRLRDILRSARERIRELDEVDADFIVDYCGGCNWMLGLAGRLGYSKPRKPILHLLEVAGAAMGDPVESRLNERCAQIVSLMKGRLLRSYLSPRRFHIEETMGIPLE